MAKKKVLKMTFLIVVGIVVLGVAVYAGMIIHWFNTTEVEMISNTHFDFVVKAGQVIDYDAFINPQDAASALNNIDKSIRLQIAEYMRENNLKLKEGHHYIRKRVVSSSEDIGTLDEHLKYFQFEPIQ